jgi:hypothetical protein
MQNMFSTMQVSPQVNPQVTQVSHPKQDSLDLLNSASSPANTDFNTMQMMFATNSQGASTIKPNPAMNIGVANPAMNLGVTNPQ